MYLAVLAKTLFNKFTQFTFKIKARLYLHEKKDMELWVKHHWRQKKGFKILNNVLFGEEGVGKECYCFSLLCR